MRLNPASGLAVAFLASAIGGCAQMPAGIQDILGGAPAPAASGPAPLSEYDIASGLKEALATGTQRAVSRIGVTDGFWRNPGIVIPLPESLKKAEKAMRAIGQGQVVEEFHLSLNRAAEAAVPEAAPIFGNAIRAMTLADARQILDGGPTAATEYFRGKTLAALTAKFKPVVTQATDRVGATRKYKDMVTQVGRYVPSYQVQDLDAYVTERALSGLFRTLGEEEKRIRTDPAARTTEILRKVFAR